MSTLASTPFPVAESRTKTWKAPSSRPPTTRVTVTSLSLSAMHKGPPFDAHCGQFPKQQRTRSNGFCQPHGYELNRCILPTCLLGRGLLMIAQCGFCPFKIHACAEVANCVDRPRQMFSGNLRLGHGGRATQIAMRASTSIAIANEIKDRCASTEVLDRRRSIRAGHC